ncbi:MAG: hypothetical protein ACYTHJ_06430 [Planctomycetota bacterium]|jgi:hypothetical protein
MPISPFDILLGFLAPAVLAGALALIMLRLLPENAARIIAAPIAVLGGFLLGYAFVAAAPWQPSDHWHWLPYLAAGAAVVASMVALPAMPAPVRVMLGLALSAAIAWLLVPDWEDLEPSRAVYLWGFATYSAAIMVFLFPAAKRSEPGRFLVAMILTSVAASAMMALSGNLRFAQICGAAVGAMIGCALAVRLAKQKPAHAGLVILFVGIVASLILVSQLHSFSEIPLFAYALIPPAPLLLLVTESGFFHGIGARKQNVFRWLILLAPSLAAIATAVAAEY